MLKHLFDEKRVAIRLLVQDSDERRGRRRAGQALEHLLDVMPEFDVDYDKLRRVTMTSVSGYANVPVRVRRCAPPTS